MASSGAGADRIDLTELDVITRYSLAVRHGTAERSELIQTLRADLAWLEGGRRTTSRSSSPRKAASSRAGAQQSTTRKTATRRSR